MKIAWALPEIAEPRTGGEKICAALEKALRERSEITRPAGLKFKCPDGIIHQVTANYNNLKELCRLDKKTLIFQNFMFRRKFFLANAVLFLIFRRKIFLCLYEETASFNSLSLKGKIQVKILYGLCLRFSSGVIVLSKSMADWVNRFGNFGNKTCIIYPVFKDSFPYSAPLLKRKSSEGRVKNLLCVANIRKNKGQEYLIEAAGLLKRRDFMVYFAGLIKEAEYYDCLMKKIKGMGLTEQICFKGFLKDGELKEMYSAADIFILPTLKEAFGMVLAEAMSFGLPVIGSNVGGIPEIVENGINGVLVPPAFPRKLAEAIAGLLDNAELRNKMGENALKRYQQLPGWKESLESLLPSLGI